MIQVWQRQGARLAFVLHQARACKASPVCKPVPMSPSPQCPSFCWGSRTPSYVAQLRAVPVPPAAQRGFGPSASLPIRPGAHPWPPGAAKRDARPEAVHTKIEKQKPRLAVVFLQALFVFAVVKHLHVGILHAEQWCCLGSSTGLGRVFVKTFLPLQPPSN